MQLATLTAGVAAYVSGSMVALFLIHEEALPIHSGGSGISEPISLIRRENILGSGEAKAKAVFDMLAQHGVKKAEVVDSETDAATFDDATIPPTISPTILSTITPTSAPTVPSTTILKSNTLKVTPSHNTEPYSPIKFLSTKFTSAPPCSPIDPHNAKVTLATASSEDRLWTISEYCSHWRGQISLVIYGNKTYDAYLETLNSFPSCSSSISRIKFFVRAPAEDEIARPEMFPVNTLRNLAISLVQTSHFLYLDIDFWPATNLFDLVHSADTIKALASDPKLAVVVPAFQRLDVDCDIRQTSTTKEEEIIDNIPHVNNAKETKVVHLSSPSLISSPETEEQIKQCVHQFKSSMPTGKGSLLSLIRSQMVSVFDPWAKEAHGTTDTNQWFRQKKNSLREVKCIKSSRWEPYLVLRMCSALPPYQESFTGYGKNKVSHIIHLTAASYTFKVIGGR